MSTIIRYAKPIALVHWSGTEFIVDVIQIETTNKGPTILTFANGSTDEVNDLDGFVVQGFVDYRMEEGEL